MAFEHPTLWRVNVKGFAGKTMYVGHGEDLRDDVEHRYGVLKLIHDEENFKVRAKSFDWGDVSIMLEGGPCFRGNNPEMGPPQVEMKWGDTTDTRKVDNGVDSVFEVEGVRYVFHRPDTDNDDYKDFDVTITKL